MINMGNSRKLYITCLGCFWSSGGMTFWDTYFGERLLEQQLIKPEINIHMKYVLRCSPLPLQNTHEN